MSPVPSEARIAEAVAAIAATGKCVAGPHWCGDKRRIEWVARGRTTPHRVVRAHHGVIAIHRDGWYDVGWAMDEPWGLPDRDAFSAALRRLTR